MRKQFILLFIIVLFINTGCKKNPTGKINLKESLQKILDENVPAYKAKFPGKPIGFGLYVKKAGSFGHGKSSQDVYVSSGFPQNYGENIQFRGASTTKSFTAAAILTLQQQNKINLDDLITDNIPGTNQPYIPATPEFAIPYKDKITIRLLLQHRAGVFDVTNDPVPAAANAPYAGKKYVDYIFAQQGDNHTFTIPELVNVIAKNQLSYFTPGTSFHYSNVGFHLLAVIIERVSGKRYHQFLQDEFLTPLQLNHTHFPYLGTDQSMPAPYVTSWLKTDAFYEIDKDNVSPIVADGNIITTPADLANWANALYATNTILNADLHAQMITGVPTLEKNHVMYGLGTEMNPPDLGYGHNGAHPAYMTIMRYNPETKASYVLVTNFLDATSLDALNVQGAGLANIVREAIQAVKRSE
ncbi:MAG: serine hydrolase domain-containing protein [Chitinophagaceae bacterium]